jgi:hypothetical protein
MSIATRSLVLYPRGYVGFNGIPSVVPFRRRDIQFNQDGDASVKVLYDAWTSANSNQDKLEFLRHAALLFKQLIADLPIFYRMTVALHGENSYHVRVLTDLIDFATTGARPKISAAGMLLLLGDASKDTMSITVVDPSFGIRMPLGLNKYNTDVFLSNCLCHDMGLDVLISTLFVLFGDEPSKAKVG